MSDMTLGAALFDGDGGTDSGEVFLYAMGPELNLSPSSAFAPATRR